MCIHISKHVYIHIWQSLIGLIFKSPPCKPTVQIHTWDPQSIRHPCAFCPLSIRRSSAVCPPSVRCPTDMYIYIYMYIYKCMDARVLLLSKTYHRVAMTNTRAWKYRNEYKPFPSPRGWPPGRAQQASFISYHLNIYLVFSWYIFCMFALGYFVIVSPS